MSGERVIRNIGTVFEPTGYAKANRYLLLELAKQGVISHFSPVHPEVVQVPLDAVTQAKLHALMHTPLPQQHPVLFHYPAIYLIKDTNQFTIGMTMFECNRLPFTWVRRCCRMDEIWVPSTFNRNTFIQSGIPSSKIQVMPYGVDLKIYTPDKPALPIPGRRGYAFLSICSFDDRKGIDILLSAFFEEFSESEDVCLIMKTRASSEAEIIQQQAHVDKIAFQTSGRTRSSAILLSTIHSWPEEELAGLYRNADSYVLPTRGEGWNMTVTEAMASGLPVITTRWSAHLDFVHDENCYLIAVQKFVPAHPTNSKLLWAVPDYHHLRQLMRHIYVHRQEAETKAMRGRQEISKLTWEASAVRILHRLQEIFHW